MCPRLTAREVFVDSFLKGLLGANVPMQDNSFDNACVGSLSVAKLSAVTTAPCNCRYGRMSCSYERGEVALFECPAARRQDAERAPHPALTLHLP